MQYQVDVAMNTATVDDLNEGSFSLCVFKAVQCQRTDGKTVVWIKLLPPQNGRPSQYGTNTLITWDEQYKAYTSISFAGGSAEVSADITLGQILSVIADGSYTVADGGVATAISIHNTTTTQFTCGIAQASSGNAGTPICAFPLYGGDLDVIAPIEKIALMFSTGRADTGAFTSGALIDLTDCNTRAVSFDMNNGWDWGGGGWGSPISATQNLSLLLIDSAGPSSTSAVKRRARVFN